MSKTFGEEQRAGVDEVANAGDEFDVDYEDGRGSIVTHGRAHPPPRIS